jgi:hypothetical protein
MTTRTIDMDDASQLSMLAYEKNAYGHVEGGAEVIKGLSSELARKIASAIVGPDSGNLEPEVERAVDYFRDWARSTSARAQEHARRPSLARR